MTFLWMELCAIYIPTLNNCVELDSMPGSHHGMQAIFSLHIVGMNKVEARLVIRAMQIAVPSREHPVPPHMGYLQPFHGRKLARPHINPAQARQLPLFAAKPQ